MVFHCRCSHRGSQIVWLVDTGPISVRVDPDNYWHHGPGQISGMPTAPATLYVRRDSRAFSCDGHVLEIFMVRFWR